MELFRKARAVRFKSAHGKYLTADEDEETVTQGRNGASRSAKWTVEFVKDMDSVIRLKSCYGKYLTASNQPFLLGMTGLKVKQTLLERLDSSVQWEPVTDHGGHIKLRTRYGQFLQANGGMPPWRNSVTHNIPHRTASQEGILWDVHVLDILMVESPAANIPPPMPLQDDDETESTGSEISLGSISNSFISNATHELNDSMVGSPLSPNEGRLVYFSIANEKGEDDEEYEVMSIPFKGTDVADLTKTLEMNLGLRGLTVCKRSPVNGRLFPLRLQLPPNGALHVVVLPPYSRPTGFVY